MIAWLPVVILAVSQITVRLRAASAADVVFLEQRRDGVGLLVAPRGLTSRGPEDTATRQAGAGSEEHA